jgi:hypothetical protein
MLKKFPFSQLDHFQAASFSFCFEYARVCAIHQSWKVHDDKIEWRKNSNLRPTTTTGL